MRLKRLTALLLAGVMMMSVALTGCGNSSIDPDVVGATLDGREISLGFMNFMARYKQASTDVMVAGIVGAEFWDNKTDGNRTLAESTKETIMENIQLLYLLEDHMEEFDVEVTEKEMTAITKAAKQFMMNNSEKAINQLGATEEYVIELLRLSTIQQKMKEAMGAKAEITVTEEDAAQRTFSYIRIAKIKEDDKKAEMTPKEQKEAVEKVAEAAKKDYDAAKDDYKGAVTSTYSYNKEDDIDELLIPVINQANKLKEGEVSDLFETDEQYYIIRLDSEYDEKATAEKLEVLEEQERQEYYQKLGEEYVKESKFEINEEEWAKVKFNKLFGPAK